MKNSILFSVVVLFLVACSTGKPGDKKSDLDSLKKERSALTEKIKKIEDELAVSDTSKKDDKSKMVAVTEMIPQTFNHYIEIQGKVESDEDVTLSSQTMGNVTAVLVRAGDKVSKDQVLATLDDKMMNQTLSEAQSQLDLAKTVYDRQKNLWDQKIGSEIQFLQAKTNKESLEKRMATLREQWNMTRIKSPINGTVDNVGIKIGQSIAPGMPAFRVVNFESLKVKGEVAESNIDKVQKGNDVIIEFPDLNKSINAKIDYSGKVINAMDRTFNVEVRLNSKSVEFHPNMIAVLKIADYANNNSFVVPVGALMRGTDGEYVFVAIDQNGKTISKRKNVVSSGMIYNGVAEIKSGIDKGDKVITTGYQNLVEGDEIKF